MKKINIFVWELKGGNWCRTGLMFADKESNATKFKTANLVLRAGHYRVVLTYNSPAAWLSSDGVMWCSGGSKQRGFFAGGGVFHAPIQKGREIQNEAWLRSCSSRAKSMLGTYKLLENEEKAVRQLL